MILTLTPPTNSGSVATSLEGAVFDRFKLLAHVTISGEPAFERPPISWQALEIDTTFPDELRSESDRDFPTRHAKDFAKGICGQADQVLEKLVSISDLEGFEGDLLVHWGAGPRRITLISPATAARTPKLYREELGENGIPETEIKPCPRVSDLVAAIQWVWKTH